MRQLLVLIVGFTLLVVSGPPVHAAKTSVEGTNAYTKLVLLNKQSQVQVKMFGPGGGDCSVKYLQTTVRDKDGTRYRLAAGCYPGATWAVSLEQGGDLVECEGASLAYVEADGYWRGKVPRSCLGGLANRIKVTTSSLDDYSPTPGEAGPTRYVARG